MGEINKSIWTLTTETPKFPALKGDMSCEVAVIGAGLAGILTAYFLQKAGLDVAVLEMYEVASGQTKNTTAKITAMHGVIYKDLLKKAGYDYAKQYAQANLEAIEQFERIIDEEKIDCDFERRPTYVYSTRESETGLLKKETEAAKRLGIKAEYTTKTCLPFPIAGAVKFENQAQYHPLKFLFAISKNLKIFTNTKVKRVKGGEIITENGTVKAKYVVFASHYPFITLPGLFFTKIYQERSYTILLENAMKLDGGYLELGEAGVDMRNIGKDLVIGGGDHRTGDSKEGGKYDFLLDRAKTLFPGSKEKERWSAQDCMTVDGIPYIGHYAEAEPSWFVATGFAKWGMTTSMIAAKIITDLITNKENPYAEVFSPQRGLPKFSFRRLFENLGQAVKGLFKNLFCIPMKKLEDLAPGHGGAVRYNGERVGAYKDEKGRLYLVDLRCPHLGCRLEWNPDEKTWDCPCHGSRFTYKGKLISNPAQENLQRKHEQTEK